MSIIGHRLKSSGEYEYELEDAGDELDDLEACVDHALGAGRVEADRRQSHGNQNGEEVWPGAPESE